MAETPQEAKSRAVVGRDPFADMSSRLERMFGDFGLPGFGLFGGTRPARMAAPFDFRAPSVDVTETEKAFEIAAELPGLDEKDVQVEVAEGVLTIKGEKKAEEEKRDEDKNYHLVERSYGSFQRSFALPDNVDENGIAADFAKGVLRVTLPKTAPSAPPERKTIKIRSR